MKQYFCRDCYVVEVPEEGEVCRSCVEELFEYLTREESSRVLERAERMYQDMRMEYYS